MKKRVLYYDILNICSAFGVILLHSNGLAHHFNNTLAWYQALAVEVLFYWPVPIFFMLSGATLMGYRERYTTSVFLKKRFMRTVIPFAVWTAISTLFYRINPFKIGIRQYLNMCISTSVESIYWFFIPLFAIYLAMPVLSLLKENRRILWYMAGGTFLLASLIPQVLSYTGIVWNSGLNFIMAGGYLLFVILGYLLSTENLSRKQRIGIYALAIFGIIIRYSATVTLSLKDGATNKTFFDYMGYYSVFLGAAVFVFFKHSKIIKKIANHKKLVNAIKIISSCSFGIYLMHMMVSQCLSKILPTDCWEWRLLIPFLIYAISLGLTYMLKKIPLLKHIVP